MTVSLDCLLVCENYNDKYDFSYYARINGSVLLQILNPNNCPHKPFLLYTELLK